MVASYRKRSKLTAIVNTLLLTMGYWFIISITIAFSAVAHLCSIDVFKSLNDTGLLLKTSSLRYLYMKKAKDIKSKEQTETRLVK